MLVIQKGLNVYNTLSDSFTDAESIECINGSLGNGYNQLSILLDDPTFAGN